VSVNTSDIAFFNARNTLNFITTRTKQKYLVDYTLDEIEELVHPNQFFRANRQFILAHDIITAVHPCFNGKLKVDLSLPLEEEIIVSRDKAPQLKAWMGA
jgi:two-component system LytT family response regulator